MTMKVNDERAARLRRDFTTYTPAPIGMCKTLGQPVIDLLDDREADRATIAAMERDRLPFAEAYADGVRAERDEVDDENTIAVLRASIERLEIDSRRLLAIVGSKSGEVGRLHAEVERLREMIHRDYDDAKEATRNVRCRCDAWRACQGIRDRGAALREKGE